MYPIKRILQNEEGPALPGPPNQCAVVQILCAAVFDTEPCATFIPINRIVCHCTLSSPLSINFDYGVDCTYVIAPFVRYALLE